MDGIKGINQFQEVVKYKDHSDESLLDDYADLWRENGVCAPDVFTKDEKEKVESLKKEILRRMFQY